MDGDADTTAPAPVPASDPAAPAIKFEVDVPASAGAAPAGGEVKKEPVVIVEEVAVAPEDEWPQEPAEGLLAMVTTDGALRKSTLAAFATLCRDEKNLPRKWVLLQLIRETPQHIRMRCARNVGFLGERHACAPVSPLWRSLLPPGRRCPNVFCFIMHGAAPL